MDVKWILIYELRLYDSEILIAFWNWSTYLKKKSRSSNFNYTRRFNFNFSVQLENPIYGSMDDQYTKYIVPSFVVTFV
jgi:hypothetical protein